MVFKVVSVEDESEIAELLRLVLGNPEIEMHSADNGRDGLALVRSLKPDLVVLDVMMPGGMNGWDVYDAIRTAPDTHKIPIIMLSVLREKAERRQSFAGSEIDLYMTKPFDTLRLRKEVERMLGRGGLWQLPPRQPSTPKPVVDTVTSPVVDPAAPPSATDAAPAALVPAPPAALVAVPEPAPAESARAESMPAESASVVKQPAEGPATQTVTDGSDKKDG